MDVIWWGKGGYKSTHFFYSWGTNYVLSFPNPFLALINNFSIGIYLHIAGKGWNWAKKGEIQKFLLSGLKSANCPPLLSTTKLHPYYQVLVGPSRYWQESPIKETSEGTKKGTWKYFLFFKCRKYANKSWKTKKKETSLTVSKLRSHNIWCQCVPQGTSPSN